MVEFMDRIQEKTGLHSILLNLHLTCFLDKLLHKEDKEEFTRSSMLCIIFIRFFQPKEGG